jgi:hypothetical protein
MILSEGQKIIDAAPVERMPAAMFSGVASVALFWHLVGGNVWSHEPTASLV